MAKQTLASTSFWGSLNEFTNSSRDSLVWTEPLLPYHSPPFFHGCLLRQAWLKRADFSSYGFLSMCCRTSKPQQIVELWNLVGSLFSSWLLCEATLLSLSVLCHTENSIKIIFLVCARTREFFHAAQKNWHMPATAKDILSIANLSYWMIWLWADPTKKSRAKQPRCHKALVYCIRYVLL
jgi:hypothetical protein